MRQSQLSKERIQAILLILECIPHIISQEDNDMLSCPFTLEEIKLAVDQLGNMKAPGPDGFHGQFYSKFWTTVAESVTSAAQSFFMQESPLENVNMTSLTLIPKVPEDRI